MNHLTKERAAEILSAARARRIVVLGDVMLDEFIWGDVSRISPEAPVPVVNIQRESTHLGGAANVLANLIALGASAKVIGVVGNDSAADKLRDVVAEHRPHRRHRQRQERESDDPLHCAASRVAFHEERAHGTMPDHA